jgi:hypothetical protein
MSEWVRWVHCEEARFGESHERRPNNETLPWTIDSHKTALPNTMQVRQRRPVFTTQALLTLLRMENRYSVEEAVHLRRPVDKQRDSQRGGWLSSASYYQK